MALNQPKFLQPLRSDVRENKGTAIEALESLKTTFSKNDFSDGTLAVARYYTDESSATTKTILGFYEKKKDSMTIFDADKEDIEAIRQTIETNKQKALEDFEKADKLDEEIKVTGVNVGNLTNGTKLEKGQSIEAILREMLMKKIDAKAVLPTVSISNSGTPSGTYEVGTSIIPNLAHAYSDGKFEGATSDYNLNQAAGCAEGETSYYRGDTKLGANMETYTLKEETVSYTCKTAYGADNVEVKDNLGGASEVSIKAGVATSNKISFTGKRYGYYGGQKTKSFEATSENIKALAKKSFETFTKIELAEGMVQIVVSFPTSWGTITKVTDDNGMNAVITDAYKKGKKENVIVKGANGEAGVSYNVYVVEFDAALGTVSHTITIS